MRHTLHDPHMTAKHNVSRVGVAGNYRTPHSEASANRGVTAYRKEEYRDIPYTKASIMSVTIQKALCIFSTYSRQVAVQIITTYRYDLFCVHITSPALPSTPEIMNSTMNIPLQRRLHNASINKVATRT